MVTRLTTLRAWGMGLVAVPIVGWVALFSLPKPDTWLIKSAYLATLTASLGCSLVAYGVARRLEPLERSTGALTRLNEDIWIDAIAVEADRRMQTYRGPLLGDPPPGFPPIESLVLPALPEGPAPDDSLEYWDLSQVTQQHHTAIIGPTGSGKSTLVQWLIAQYFPASDVRVYDSDCLPSDWPGLPVMGRGGDFAAIADGMADDLEQLRQRTELRGRGATVGPELVRVCEEYPTVAGELDDLSSNKKFSLASEWMKKLLRRGRKYRIKLFVVGTEFQVKSMRIEGEGEVRQNFTVLYLDESALTAVRTIQDRVEREQLTAWLKTQERAAIVRVKGQFYPVRIPQLQLQPASTYPSAQHPLAPGHHQPAPDYQHPLAPLLDKTFSDSAPTAPLASADPQHPEITPDVRGAVIQLKRSGMGQDAIIQQVWGCSKGSNPNYLAAREKYRQIIADAGLQ